MAGGGALALVAAAVVPMALGTDPVALAASLFGGGNGSGLLGDSGPGDGRDARSSSLQQDGARASADADGVPGADPAGTASAPAPPPSGDEGSPENGAGPQSGPAGLGVPAAPADVVAGLPVPEDVRASVTGNVTKALEDATRTVGNLTQAVEGAPATVAGVVDETIAALDVTPVAVPLTVPLEPVAVSPSTVTVTAPAPAPLPVAVTSPTTSLPSGSGTAAPVVAITSTPTTAPSTVLPSLPAL